MTDERDMFPIDFGPNFEAEMETIIQAAMRWLRVYPHLELKFAPVPEGEIIVDELYNAMTWWALNVAAMDICLEMIYAVEHRQTTFNQARVALKMARERLSSSTAAVEGLAADTKAPHTGRPQS